MKSMLPGRPGGDSSGVGGEADHKIARFGHYRYPRALIAPARPSKTPAQTTLSGKKNRSFSPVLHGPHTPFTGINPFLGRKNWIPPVIRPRINGLFDHVSDYRAGDAVPGDRGIGS